MVHKEQDVFIAKVGWDGKPSGEVGSRPLTAMNGVSARGRRERKTGGRQDEG